MVTCENKLIVDRLKKINDQIQANVVSKIVILNTLEFVKQYHIDDRLKAIVQELVIIGREENKPLEKSALKAYEQITYAFKRIKAYVDTHEMIKANTSTLIQGMMDEFVVNEQTLQKKHIELTEKQYYNVCNILVLLAIDSEGTNAHLEFIKEFVADVEIYKGNIYIKNFDFAPGFLEWRLEMQQFARTCKTKVWHCWDTIAWLSLIYNNYERLAARYRKNDDKIGLDHLNNYFDELRRIAVFEQGPKTSIYFDINTIKYCVQKVFDVT